MVHLNRGRTTRKTKLLFAIIRGHKHFWCHLQWRKSLMQLKKYWATSIIHLPAGHFNWWLTTLHIDTSFLLLSQIIGSEPARQIIGRASNPFAQHTSSVYLVNISHILYTLLFFMLVLMGFIKYKSNSFTKSYWPFLLCISSVNGC